MSTIPAVGAVVLLIFFTKTASAMLGLGVSPAEVVFSNLYIDGYGQQSIVISSSSAIELEVYLSLEGEGADWLTLEPPSVRVSMGNPAAVRITAEPEDASPGEHVIFLSATASPSPESSEGAVSIVQPELRIPIILSITGTAEASCSAGVSVGSVEENHGLPLRIALTNTGNVRMSPAVTVDILSQDEELLKSHSFTVTVVRPGKSAEHRESFSHGLEEGTYWMIVGVCGQYSTHELKVIQERPLSVTLEEFSVPQSTTSDEYVPLTFMVRNPHARAVEVVGVAEIIDASGESLTVRSERVWIASSEEQTLTLYYQPERSGRGEYVVRGYIESLDSSGEAIYTEKHVIERTTTLSSPSRNVRLALLFAGFCAIGLIGFILLTLIHKEHRKIK